MRNNLYIAQIPGTYPRGVNTSIMSKEEHQLIFEKFCSERYADKSRRTSKTVSEEKAKRIRQAVKGEHSGVTASFRHWVNRTKELNCAEMCYVSRLKPR